MLPLLKSTKETPNNAEKYVDALRAQQITVYNPRNKAFLEQQEVLGLLGALLAVLDSQGRHVPQRPTGLATLVANCRAEYQALATAHSSLRKYVGKAHASLAAHPGAFLSANLQELVYYLLSLPPFDGWAQNPVQRVRLSRITALIESFASMPIPGYPRVSRGHLRASPSQPGEVSGRWTAGFCYLLFGYLSRSWSR